MQKVPLLLVGGPAGAGKSTVHSELVGKIPDLVILESDVLWRAHFETRHEEFRRTWLRIAAEIGRSGFPVAIFGAGFAVPHNIETTPERSEFSAVHYLALICDDDSLAGRIRRRAAPRCTSDEHVAEHVEFNGWLRNNGPTSKPPVTLLDTTNASVAETSAAVSTWILRCLGR